MSSEKKKQQVPLEQQTSAEIMAGLEPTIAMLHPSLRKAFMMIGLRASKFDMVCVVVDGAHVPFTGPAPGLLTDGPQAVSATPQAPPATSASNAKQPRPRAPKRTHASRGNVAYRDEVVGLLISVLEAGPEADVAAEQSPRATRRAAVVTELKELGLNHAVLSQTGGTNLLRWVHQFPARIADEAKRNGYLMRIQNAMSWSNAQLASVIETGKLPSAPSNGATISKPGGSSSDKASAKLSTHELDLMRLELLEARKQGGAKIKNAKRTAIEAQLVERLGPPKPGRCHITRVTAQMSGDKLKQVLARLLVHARGDGVGAFGVMLKRICAATKYSDKTLTKLAHDHEGWVEVTAAKPAPTPDPAAN